MSARPADRGGVVPGLRAYLLAADLLEPLEAIARAYHVPPDTILSMRRTEPTCSARFAYWQHLHDVCGWSYPTIAFHWSCNHTTVLTGCRRHRSRVAVCKCPAALAPSSVGVPDAGGCIHPEDLAHVRALANGTEKPPKLEDPPAQ